MSGIGMNLQSVCYWSSEQPFLDRFKTSGAWAAYDGTTYLPDAHVQLDANGYATGMPPGANTLMTLIAVDPASSGQDDTYVLTYTGKATFLVDGTILSQKDGEVVFRLNGNNNGMETLQLTNMDPNDPVTSIHVVRQDQVDLFNSGEIFNPAFIAKASGWDSLRFKDWENTDNSDLTSWDQRTPVANASWSGNATGKGGVPIEVQVQLANETHSNMWVDVPAKADDDYVRQMMAYIHDHLDPGLKVSLEYSNEVWNWGYSQAGYALDMGDKLWGTDANGDGRIDRNDPAEHVSDGWMQYYGYRSAQVAAIAKAVFGDAPDRLNAVLTTQTTWEGLEDPILKGVAKAGVGDASALFKQYAVTTYFGNELDGFNADDQAKVLGWARAGSAGVDAAFRELQYGDQGLSGHLSLEDLKGIFAYQKGVADAHGMSLVAYEGGVHLTAVFYDASVQAEVSKFFQTLENDPRMGDLYARMAAEFSAAGGTMLAAYQDTSTPTQFGDWGVLGSIYDTGSARYDALRAVQNISSLAAVQTDQASYRLSATEAAVTYTGTGAFQGQGNDFDNVLIGGPGGNILHGEGGADQLFGGAGNDLLDGGLGADRMAGGAGNDTYIVDNAGDVVTELPGGGTDQILSMAASYVLPDNVENLSADTDDAFTGTGNALDNVVTGGDGNDHLFGLAGADTLAGGAGDDTLDGGTGADRMVGGDGNDVYVIDSASDVAVEQPGGGIDEVRTSLTSFQLGTDLEKLTYTGTTAFTGHGNAADNVLTGGDGGNSLFGHEGADTLVGGAGSDLLDGGTGADRMVGGGGNDTYLVDDPGDVVVEAADGGTDLVKTTLASYGMTDNVEQLQFTGSGPFTGFGNASDNVITGGAASLNSLGGGAGNDLLTGGALADQLDGGSGADTLIGGAGDDTYYVDDAGDKVVERLNEGTDRVIATIDYNLSANVENLQLAGAALRGGGNGLNNILCGDDLANVLNGNGGDDGLYGGAGNDTLTGGIGADTLFGDADDDLLNGGAGNDILLGGDGNDVLVGGAGRDILWGGAGADRFLFRPGDFATAPDAVTPSVAWADAIGDFSHADGDRIDLSNLRRLVADGSGLRFVGGNDFSHHAGEIRMTAVSGGYDVGIDLSGRGTADLHLIVTTPAPLVAADFTL